MRNAEQECSALMNLARTVLQKTTQGDLQDARNKTAVIDGQNKRNKEILDSIKKYDFDTRAVLFFTTKIIK